MLSLNTVYRETPALHPVFCGLKIKGSGLTCSEKLHVRLNGCHKRLIALRGAV